LLTGKSPTELANNGVIYFAAVCCTGYNKPGGASAGTWTWYRTNMEIAAEKEEDIEGKRVSMDSSLLKERTSTPSF
jgi:hypothetical protein